MVLNKYLNNSGLRKYFSAWLCLNALFLFNNLIADNTLNDNQLSQPISNNNIVFHTSPMYYSYHGTRCILRDNRGLMWFGNQNGLVRYDGVNLKVYENEEDDINSISSNIITALLEDKDHNLWIGTSTGLNLYNRAQDNFRSVYEITGLENLLDKSFISALLAANDSIIWIGTHLQGLIRYNTQTNQLKNIIIDTPEGMNANINCILSDSTNNLWIGTQTGLVLFKIKSGSFSWFQHAKDNPLSISGNNISSLQKDIYGSIWVGTQDKGINRIVKLEEAYSFERFSNISGGSRISSNAINDLYADKHGNLWIGTENDGLNKLNLNTREVVVYTNEPGNEKSISSNSIWSIYGDPEGRIWTGSYNKGINIIDFNYSKFESFLSNPYSKMSLPYNDVRGFCETNNNKIWIATDGGGICRFDLNTHSYDKIVTSNKKQNSLINNSTQSILYDNADIIWVGTWGGGVDRISQNGKFIKNYKIENESGIGNNKIKTLHQDVRGNIWVGTDGSGLYLYNESSDQFEVFVYKNLLNKRTYASAIQSESDSTIWIGTLSGLIYLELDKKNNVLRTESYTIDNSTINSNKVDFIHIDQNMNIWLGTNNGASMFNPQTETFRVFRKKDGLSSNIISGILEDDNGNIWISTNSGISRIDSDSYEITNYTTDDGLSSNEFYSKSCLKTKDGALLFGSKKGFNLIHPDQIKTNPHIPNILLTGLKINNNKVDITTYSSPLVKQLSESDTLILNYKQTTFSIDFVALNYTRPARNQFSYILEGYDDDWNFIGTRSTATYTKVAPGKYTFKVLGSNNDGIWNEIPKTLFIVIKPPIWKTNWAYLLYIISFIALTAFILKTWQDRFHIKNQLELERQAKEKGHELNKKNLQFFTNVSHEFRTPLSLIIGPLDSLLLTSPLEMHEQLKVIQKNSQRLVTLTNNLMDLRKLEEGGMTLNVKEHDIKILTDNILEFFKVRINRLEINLKVNFLSSQSVCWMDKEKFFTIMFNLLSNAIKYTSEKGDIQLDIKDHSETGQLEISITNTGSGIDPSELPFVFDKFYQSVSGIKRGQFGSGVGLSLTKGLVELHGGKIWATSTPDQETRFTFTIPINRLAYRAGDMLSETSEVTSPEVYMDSYENEKIEDDLYETKNEKTIILIVEDNADLRLFLKNQFKETYSVVLAENGEEGLQKANEVTPDLIISDIVMPVMSGLEFCKAIKNDVRTSHIPIVLLTARITTAEQIEGFDTGADAYITKPFHLELLKTQVTKLIQSRNELYARFSQDVYITAHKKTNNEIDQIFLQKTIDYILDNLTDSKLNIEKLALIHNMSHRNFYRKIKALTGNPIVVFIKNIRLKQALKLMETQKYQLAEISYMTGFSSPSYFTKSFREFYGKPPSDYLKN